METTTIMLLDNPWPEWLPLGEARARMASAQYSEELSYEAVSA
jgi:hypothetical protein